MSVLLFVGGALLVVLGVAMVGYGVPINEFSFGNTLIVAGTVAAVGGLIVIAIGVAVGELRKIFDGLGARPAARSSRPLETFEPAPEARPAPGRIPFAPKPAPETALREPHPLEQRMAASEHAEMPYDLRANTPPTPALRNPEIPAVNDYEDISLLPGKPVRSAPPSNANGFGMPERRSAAGGDVWRAPSPRPTQQPSNFENMWPSEPKPAPRTAAEMPPEPKPDFPPPQPAAAPDSFKPRSAPEARAAGVAILKSGVVDGMAYTLYVDGSIEAELPQGTLRFASINDLRSHLAKSA